MNSYTFKSVFKDEFTDFLDVRKSQGFKDRNVYMWQRLDEYMSECCSSKSDINARFVEDWLAKYCARYASSTISYHIGAYNAFAEYLNRIGINATPYDNALSSGGRRYVPYIFNQDEMARIIETADAGDATGDSLSKIQMPMLIRLLYGCGARLGEALSLHLDDIDLDSGIIQIRNGKGNKDRLVPLDDSLTSVLRLYCTALFAAREENPFLFESNYKDSKRNCVGHRRNNSWAERNFLRILKEAGIEQPAKSRNERGICIHCLRHTFIVDSYRKQDIHGDGNYRVMPLISTYVGHKGLLETQRYVHLTNETASDIVGKTSAKYKGLFPEVPK